VCPTLRSGPQHSCSQEWSQNDRDVTIGILSTRCLGSFGDAFPIAGPCAKRFCNQFSVSLVPQKRCNVLRRLTFGGSRHPHSPTI
jgi:hypothetical protein